MKKIIFALSLLAVILYVAADNKEYEYEEDEQVYEDDVSEDGSSEPTPTVSTPGERTVPPRFDRNILTRKSVGAIRERRNADANQFFRMLASNENHKNAVINSLSPIVGLWAISAEKSNPTTSD